MVQVIVERRFDFPLSPRDQQATASRLERFTEQYRIRWVRSYLAANRRRMIDHFEAQEAEVVRAAYGSAGLRFERTWVAELVSPEVASVSGAGFRPS